MSLEALERSDLSRLPGGIFTRSFIRAYAEEVGLDPDRMIQEFIAELPPEAATATAHPAMVEDGEELESERSAVATAMRLILVSLPIIGLIIYYGTHRIPGLPVSSKPETDAGEHSQTRGQKAAGLKMNIAPSRSCRVSVTADGEPVFSGLMNAGDTRVVSAHEEILISVDDAGAFAYTLNGRHGRPLGAPGEAVSKRVTLSNLHEFSGP